MSNACRVRRLAVAHERRQIAYALENLSALKNAKIKKKKNKSSMLAIYCFSGFEPWLIKVAKWSAIEKFQP